MSKHSLPHNPDLDPAHQKRLVLAVVISTIVMGLWYYFYQIPLQNAKEQERVRQRFEQAEKLKEAASKISSADIAAQIPGQPVVENVPQPSREEVLKASPRIKISNGRIHGSIRLIGARLDDVTLVDYREKLDKNSPEIALMNPQGAGTTNNFIETGWISADPAIKVPDSNSLWKAESSTELTPETPVVISWENGQGQKFFITYTIDKDFMFNVTQSVESQTTAKFFPFGLVSKSEKIEDEQFILHTGPLGVINGELQEVSYGSLRDEPLHEFNDASGWIGITDKYWFKSLIPASTEKFKATFRSTIKDDVERFQIDYLGTEKVASAGAPAKFNTRIFTGAKELKLLERYSTTENIPLFERAIDFGWFYFITKPMYYLLINFYAALGNFGLSIMLLTFCVKLCLFPLARKSYISMGKLKILQPRIKELQARYKDDKMELQKQMMGLYKKEKVNPAAGCLPILLQIPIFFSLYKVFFVSIEMRHAPFFGWIKDLSERDPTSIFNLFGLLPFEVPQMMMIGFFPCLMALTMYIQQQLQPMPADPVTAKMMKLMPVVFLVMFASFPSGLVIYWCFSNLFTIAQQLYFLRQHPRKHHH